MTATLNTLPDNTRADAFSIWDNGADMYHIFPAHWSPHKTPVNITYMQLVALGWSAAQSAFGAEPTRFPAKLITETAAFLKANGDDSPVVEEVTLIGWNAAVKVYTI
jgi:hypothetical protein